MNDIVQTPKVLPSMQRDGKWSSVFLPDGRAVRIKVDSKFNVEKLAIIRDDVLESTTDLKRVDLKEHGIRFQGTSANNEFISVSPGEDKATGELIFWCNVHAADQQKSAIIKEVKRPWEKEINQANLSVKEIWGKFNEHKVDCLWYISHKNNVRSILEHGILNHNDSQKYSPERIDNKKVNEWREEVHDFVPLYIKPKNPMLYEVYERGLQNDLCLIKVNLSVISGGGYIITDGNAASRDTKFFTTIRRIDNLPWDVLNAQYWHDYEDGKRKKCAEVLIYPKVKPDKIDAIHCYSQQTEQFLRSICGDVNVERTPERFFDPK